MREIYFKTLAEKEQIITNLVDEVVISEHQTLENGEYLLSLSVGTTVEYDDTFIIFNEEISELEQLKVEVAELKKLIEANTLQVGLIK